MDAAHGIQVDGEDLPQLTEMDYQAERVAALLMPEPGRLDWQNLPFICAWLGITDIEGLMLRLITFVTYRPRKINGHCETVD